MLQFDDDGTLRNPTDAEKTQFRQDIGAAAIGSGAIQIPFSTTVPLDGNKVMPRTQVAGAVAFVIGTKVPGGQCRIPLTSDGTNVPTIVGASEWVSSFGYDNSAANKLNVIDLWTDDAGPVYYSWAQPIVNTPSDTTAPVIGSASVANAAPSKVVVVFNEAMDTSVVPTTSMFTVTGHTISSVAWDNSTTLGLTVSAPFVNGEAVRNLGYVLPGSGGARDLAGNLLQSVSSIAITNNVQPTDTTAPTLTGASVSGSALSLVYSEPLNTTAPALTAYSVIGAGSVTQSPSAIAIAGSTVTLTLATPAVNGDNVTLNYTPPGTNPIRDTAGNSAAALTSQVVTNSTSGDDFANWLARLTAVGGDASTTEKDAVQAFISTAKTGATPFWDCITRANVFVNNANGSLVPFKIQSGSTNDTSPGATTVNPGGRTSTGAGYVNTQTPPPAIVGGLSVYLRDIQSFSPAVTNVLVGARDAGNANVFRIVGNLRGDGTAVAGYISGAWGGVNTSQMEFNLGAGMNVGHWHVQRNSATALKLRQNGTLIGTEFTTSTTVATVSENIYVFAQNGGGTAGAFTRNPTSIGYYAILGTAMSDAQATAYNAAVVAMMTAMSRNL